MKLDKSFLRFNIIVLFIIVILFMVGNYIKSACWPNIQRLGRFCCPDKCNIERTDGRCNDDSECCPGRRCSSFGYCEPCD